MGQIKILQNPVQHYAWGSYTAIPALLGQKSPAAHPCAELWMGAHPKSPSRVVEQGQTIPLNEWIQTAPDKILGEGATEKFGHVFPFLFKVLAAEQPLSIQAHPDKQRAREGFFLENRAGIPLDDPVRNYRDANHKPECICALTPFSGLCGFRPLPDILYHFTELLPEAVEEITGPLKHRPDEAGLKMFLQNLLLMDKGRATGLVAAAVERAGRSESPDPAWEWVTRLHRDRPDDIMALAPAFLNHFLLLPGQALFLPAGVLHSYLNGTGIELMANSDNVLRGGLTHKHVDVAALLGALVFSEMRLRILEPVAVTDCESHYPADTEEFALSVIRVVSEQNCRVRRSGNVEILFCTAGRGEVFETATRTITPFKRGEALLVPAFIGPYVIIGDAELYKATVPA